MDSRILLTNSPATSGSNDGLQIQGKNKTESSLDILHRPPVVSQTVQQIKSVVLLLNKLNLNLKC